MNSTKVVKSSKNHRPYFNKGDVYRNTNKDSKRYGTLCVVIYCNTVGETLVTYVDDGVKVWLKGDTFRANHKHIRKGVRDEK